MVRFGTSISAFWATSYYSEIVASIPIIQPLEAYSASSLSFSLLRIGRFRWAACSISSAWAASNRSPVNPVYVFEATASP